MYPVCYGKNPRYPHPADFQVVERDGDCGKGTMSFRQFEPGDLIAEINGEIIYEMTQHSLQIEPGVHLADLYFAGYFLHSCSPNVSVNMKQRLVYAVKPIQVFDFLEMDYAETEEVLFKQFACRCGAPNCRGWITGSAELADENDPVYQQMLFSQKFVA